MTNIHKDLEQILKSSSCMIFYAKVTLYSHYPYWLQEELMHFGLRVAFWSEGIGTFWSEGIRTIWHRKSQTKNQQYSQRVLNYNNCSCIMFHAKLSRNSHFTHYLHTTQTTHYLPTPISFISDLAYITRTNPILWSNLNYKKLLKCVNTTNFYA